MMTGKRQIDYEALAQDAMRGIVRSVLMRAATSGLPGDHHFYIAFDTRAPGVVVSNRLKEKYPEEMTIVLQHQFRQLAVNDEQFEVTLSFDNVPERLTVPLRAIRVFFDPSVPYGLQFEGSDLIAEAVGDLNPDDAEVPEVGGRSGASRRPGGEAELPPNANRLEKVRAPRKPRVLKGDTASDTVAKSGADASARRPLPRRQAALPKPITPRPDEPANDAKVVELDKFRKR